MNALSTQKGLNLYHELLLKNKSKGDILHSNGRSMSIKKINLHESVL